MTEEQYRSFADWYGSGEPLDNLAPDVAVAAYRELKERREDAEKCTY